MKAMIFAAGLGTRLRPLTLDKPKALVEVNGMTMLEIAILKLKHAGVKDIVINLHQFSEKIKTFIKNRPDFDVNIRFSDETDMLLDTGGGLKKAASWLIGDTPFFVYNVDIFTDLDLREMLQSHLRSKALATLAIKQRPGSRFFLFDQDLRLRGWKNLSTGEEKLAASSSERLSPFAFSGVHLIEPDIFQLISEEGVFSIVDVYLRMAREHIIRGYLHQEDLWIDLGKPEKITEGEDLIGKFGLERFIGKS